MITRYPGSYVVYALGFRNIQGLVITHGGIIYTSEHGDAAEDEINLIVPNEYSNISAHFQFALPNNYNNLVDCSLVATMTISEMVVTRE